MNDKLAAAVSSVDKQLTAGQWADALWLARYLPVPRPAEESADGTPPESVPPSARRPTPPAKRDGGDVPRPSGTSGPAEPGATLHLPGQSAREAAEAAGAVVQVPSVPALPGTLDLLRSLRPLRMNRPSMHHLVVDEEATAALIADSSIWTPVLRPSQVRRFDVAVVVDVSTSMVIWQRTISEFHSLLQNLGAFRDINTWRVDTDEPGIPLRRGISSVHAAGELTDPTDRKVILVVSDCVGAGWRDGTMAARLEAWARHDPVAIIQVLPQRMWRRCGPEFKQVRLSARRPGASNAELFVRMPDGQGVKADQGLVIPVLELDSRWLGPWSRLIAGGVDPISTMAMLSRAPSRPVSTSATPAASANEDPEEPTPVQRVYSFRNTSSPVAFQLAAFLAATPLSLPVIRLVQNAMLPESRPAHLAEFFLGDLIHRVSAEETEPDNVLYEFHEGVRDLLLTRLRRSDTLRILHQVADYISQRFGAPRDFRAILAAESSIGLGIPFARILRQVLTALGGSYASFAATMRGSTSSDLLSPEIVEIVSSTGDIERGVGAAAPVIPSRHRASDPKLGGDVSTADSPASPVKTVERPPAIFEGVPTRNPHFTGRESLLDDLRARLSSSVTALLPQALHGLGGVGKTQLAVEFCHRFAHNYDLVLWVPAEQPAIARNALAQLAEKLQLPRYEDQSQAVAAVLQTLRRGEVYSRWILVFDNADRPEDLEALLPDIQGPGHILVTSRNQRWSDLAKVLEVDVFTRPESINLLERRSPGISKLDADQLAEKLGDLPLALEQAAAWQAETGMPVAEYLELLDERMEQLLDVTSLGNYPKSVAATWRIAFERLTVESPISLQLLELCAFFGAEPIANQLMPMGRFAPSLSPELRKTVADSIALHRAIRHLGRYALAKVDHPTSSVQVHRLVQAVLREKVTAAEADAYRLGVQEILAAYNPGDPDKQDTWVQHARISPHVIASGAVDGSTDDIRRLVLDQVLYFQKRGYFRDSAELGDLAYQQWRDDPTLGPDHEDTLVCGRLLAISLRWLGQTDRAREINEDTLARQQRVFGETHEHSLVTANSLGADLRLAGELKAARELGEKTYTAQLRVFLEEDINTLHAANNRAVDLRLQGHFRAATELDEKTLATRRRVLGEGHPLTLLSYMNLGCDLLYSGRYPESRNALHQAIEGYEKIFGPEHIPLLLAYRFLAVLIRRTGDFQGSYDFAVANVQRYERRLGSDHEQTLTATMGLCNAMRALGQSGQSADRARRLLGEYRELVGESHPLTLACAANLAITLRQTGELREARLLDEAAGAEFTSQLGKEHPSSLSVGNNLANDLYLAGEHEAAFRLSKTTYERSLEVRGVDNAYTLAAASNHVIDLRTAGREDQARALEIDTWHRFRALLGERHPDTIASMSGVRIDAEIDPPPY
jgi:tetratricopeptide (TPR) repeat protein